MADNDRWRTDQERYGYRDDDRDRWRYERRRYDFAGNDDRGRGYGGPDEEPSGYGRFGSDARGGRFSDYAPEYEGGYSWEGDYRGGYSGGAGEFQGFGGGGRFREDYGRGPGSGTYGGGTRERRSSGYGAFGTGGDYRGGGRAYRSRRGGSGDYGQSYGADEDYGDRQGAYAGGGRNREMAARDFGGGLGFGTGYGGRGDYDPSRQSGEQYLGGMYYGGGEVRGSDRGQGTGFDWEGTRGERGFFERVGDEVASWFGDEDAERRRRMDAPTGQHRGRGPKGYTRSDDRIREDVCDRLTDDPRIDASEIEVSVSSSEVTLTGTVDSREAKRRAEDCAERIPGVTHVQNNLRVNQGTSGGTAASIGIGSTTGAAGTGMAADAGGASTISGGTTTGANRVKSDTTV